jgi:hypothetical protein
VLKKLFFEDLLTPVDTGGSELPACIGDHHITVRYLGKTQHCGGVDGGQQVVDLKPQALRQFRQVFPASPVVDDFKETTDSATRA